MSRSGYIDDIDDPLVLGRWRGRVASAIRGRRGQALLKEALAALDAMTDKKLVSGHLVFDGFQPVWDGEEVVVGGDVLVDRYGNALPMGSVCLLGAVGQRRGVDMSTMDPEDSDRVSAAFDIADPLAREIVFENDENGPYMETPEHRWKRMRAWVASHIKSD